MRYKNVETGETKQVVLGSRNHLRCKASSQWLAIDDEPRFEDLDQRSFSAGLGVLHRPDEQQPAEGPERPLDASTSDEDEAGGGEDE